MRTGFAVVLLCAAPVAALAQRVGGTVRATGTLSPMSEVTITLLDSVRAAIAQGRTNRDGRYDLELAADAKWVRATRIGYRPIELFIQRGTGDATVDVTMDVLRELDTVVTTGGGRQYEVPRLQDFETRRLSGLGRFISEDELRKHDNRSVGDVIRTYVPGVRLVLDQGQLHIASTSAPFMNSPIPYRRNGPIGCWSTVYLDGVMIYQGGEPPKNAPPEVPPDVNQFLAMSLSGVEYHASSATVPLQFKNIKNPCGTLLLWTRGK